MKKEELEKQITKLQKKIQMLEIDKSCLEKSLETANSIILHNEFYDRYELIITREYKDLKEITEEEYDEENENHHHCRENSIYSDSTGCELVSRYWIVDYNYNGDDEIDLISGMYNEFCAEITYEEYCHIATLNK